MTYREPGRSVDETEVECTKIREAAETKRQALKEKEETKRKKIAERGDGWIWPHLVFGAVLLSIAAGTTCLGHRYLEGKYPGTEPCTESAEVISSSTPARQCPGGQVETEPAPSGDTLVKCRCHRPAPKASAAPSASQ